MRTKWVRSAVAAAVLAGSGLVWGLSTGLASAGSSAAGTAVAGSAVAGSAAVSPPIVVPETAGVALTAVSSVSGLVVDGPRRRVLAGDPAANRIVALDYAGKASGSVSVSGPGVLTLSADRRTLYVASADESTSAIVVYDVATLSVKARYPLGGRSNVSQVVPAGGKIWFSFRRVGTSGDWASVDPADGTVEEQGFTAAPLLAVSPADPDLLAVSTTSGDAYLYDVSGSTPAVVTQRYLGGLDIVTFRQLAFTADGSQLFVGGYGGKAFVSVPALDSLGVVPIGGFAAADVDAAAGTIVADTPSGYGPDLALYPAGAVAPGREWEFPITGRYPPIIAGIAWEPGGGHAFLIASNAISELSFWVIDGSTPSVLAISAPATATRGAALTIKGTLSGAPGGSAVMFTRKDLESPAGTALPGTAVRADGTFTFSDKPPAGGPVTYTVAYAGNALHKPASATAAVTVSRTTPALTISGNGVVHAYKSSGTFTANLGPTYKNRTVEIWADPYGADLPNRLLKKATVDSKGNVTATVSLTRTTTVSAVFPGDARYAARTVRATANTKVDVSTALRGNYKTASSYAYFRKSVHPTFHTAMTPYPNRRQKLSFEYYSAGKWQPWRTALLQADSTYTLTGTHKTGIHYRVRPIYVNGTSATASGDTVNYTTYGAYKYFTFTS